MNRCTVGFHDLPCAHSRRGHSAKIVKTSKYAMKLGATRAYFTVVFAIIFIILGAKPLSASAQTEQGGATQQVPQTAIGQPGLRRFPPNALRGKMIVVQAPVITMDGKPERLSPGARIRGLRNELVLSAAIDGQEVVVNFTRESYGNVHEVWILTPEEQKQKIQSATPERNFIFSFELDKPKTDDGKTPFNQLPKFKQ